MVFAEGVTSAGGSLLLLLHRHEAKLYNDDVEKEMYVCALLEICPLSSES